MVVARIMTKMTKMTMTKMAMSKLKMMMMMTKMTMMTKMMTMMMMIMSYQWVASIDWGLGVTPAPCQDQPDKVYLVKCIL